MGFLDQLDIRVYPEHATVVVLQERLRYQTPLGTLLIVPSGFKCDLASVPRWVRSIATPWNLSARAGVLHDCGCRWYEVWKIPRREMDQLYRQALIDEGVSRWRAWIQFAAIRIGGRRAWEVWRVTIAARKGPRPLVPART